MPTKTVSPAYQAAVEDPELYRSLGSPQDQSEGLFVFALGHRLV